MGDVFDDEARPVPSDRFVVGEPISKYRDGLVEKYLGEGHVSVKRDLQSRELTSSEILGLIIMEMLDGNEEMLGTQLMLAEEGDLRSSTATTVKRAEILKGVADIVTKRMELNQRASDIDFNSPAFVQFQTMCFGKMVAVLEEMNLDDEAIELAVRKWTDKMENWPKELKAKLEEQAQ